MRERREFVCPAITRVLLGSHVPAGEVTRCFQPVCAAAKDDDDDLYGAIARPTPAQWRQLIFIEATRNDFIYIHTLTVDNSTLTLGM